MRDERRALEHRIEAADQQRVAAEGAQTTGHCGHGRLRLRAAEPAHLSTDRPLGRLVGRGG